MCTQVFVTFFSHNSYAMPDGSATPKTPPKSAPVQVKQPPRGPPAAFTRPPGPPDDDPPPSASGSTAKAQGQKQLWVRAKGREKQLQKLLQNLDLQDLHTETTVARPSNTEKVGDGNKLWSKLQRPSLQRRRAWRLRGTRPIRVWRSPTRRS